MSTKELDELIDQIEDGAELLEILSYIYDRGIEVGVEAAYASFEIKEAV